MEESNPYMYRA